MRITVAQLNPQVGNIDTNLDKLLDALKQAHEEKSDLLVLPELYLTGYPPQDLLEKSWFIEKSQQALESVQALSDKYPETGILLGAPIPHNKGGKGLYNSAVLIYQGKVLARQNKSLLPVYDVFDEQRYFDPAEEIQTVVFKDEVLGISICEDLWNDPNYWSPGQMYKFDPVQILAEKDASLFINISASPFDTGKEGNRLQIINNHVQRHRLPLLYVNQVGANDELIFDGRSILFKQDGELAYCSPAFKEDIHTIDTRDFVTHALLPAPDNTGSVYAALVLGIKDYMKKCGFKKAVLGLSGGIDSALTACLASEAAGPQNVLAISLPSPHSSRASIDDSQKLAENLGIEFKIIPINAIYKSYLHTLQNDMGKGDLDITEQNIQARIRGNILMAYSNKYQYLLLSTGNKSEMAVGYCTLYGDMSGGLSVLADVPKTMVYELSSYINRAVEIIPQEIISKAPSAELKPGQLDQDELPPYPILDNILHYYVEEGLNIHQITEHEFDLETVKWVVEAVNKNEYKRRQAAPGLKISTKAFGTGRRMPIAATIKPS